MTSKKIVKKTTPVNKKKVANSSSQENPMPEAPKFKVPMAEDKNGIMVPHLTMEHRLQAELFLAQIAAAQNEARALSSDATIMEQNAILRVRQLRHEASVKQQDAVQVKSQADQFWKRLSALYNIDFKHAGYDDQTGLITVDPRRGQKE